MTPITIRNADENDKPFVISNVARLLDFGPPAWRDRATMVATDTAVLERALTLRPPGSVVKIAEGKDKTPLGFIHLTTEFDYYSQKEVAHIADLVVADSAEGQGVGAALIEAGEAWARTQGYTLLSLNVFVRNSRARAVYEKVGFEADTLRYLKTL